MSEETRTRRCEPCRKGAPPATREQLDKFSSQNPDWQIVEVEGVPRVQRLFLFDDFVSAMSFANGIGKIAEEEMHHPLLQVEWGRVLVAWWTHKIQNIHRNDLIMAIRSDELFASGKWRVTNAATTAHDPPII